uniref:Uncharacterized protein n=1 Tax=Rhizophora mucronata TaxID=61149 RepID=A0A2P2PHX5_RHIMU
MCLQEVQH